MISRRWTSGLIAAVLLAAGSQPVMAGDGWYLGMDLGLAIAPGLTTQGSANDVGTKCDRFLNPALAEVTTECNTLPPLTRFSSDIDAGVGLLSGASIGRRIGAVRLEAEYVYHSTTHDDRANAQAGDGGTIAKLNQELALVEEGLDDVMAHSIFANLYYDLPTPSKWTPYLGAGIGISSVTLDYFNRWTRRSNPDAITTFTDPILRNRLAGTTSVLQAKLSDTVLGYQVMAGMDYWLHELVTIGLKARYTDFAAFQTRQTWDQVRSHPSAGGPGGPLTWSTVQTNDLQFFGGSLSVKYHF